MENKTKNYIKTLTDTINYHHNISDNLTNMFFSLSSQNKNKEALKKLEESIEHDKKARKLRNKLKYIFI